jgi:hypothetical protein
MPNYGLSSYFLFPSPFLQSCLKAPQYAVLATAKPLYDFVLRIHIPEAAVHTLSEGE